MDIFPACDKKYITPDCLASTAELKYTVPCSELLTENLM